VKVVGSALGGDVDDASGDTAELGKVAVGLNFELIQGVDIRSDHVGACKVTVIVNAIQGERIAAVGLSIDGREDQVPTRGVVWAASAVCRY